MPLSFMTKTVTVLRAPLFQSRGSFTRNWGEAQSHVIGNCQVTGVATSQERDGRVTQVSDRKRLRAPFGSDIQAGDRVVVDGVTYEVDGEVFCTESPTGAVSSVRCDLVKWGG